MSFRDNLIHLRAANNMTQEQLAVLLGVSRQAVTKWESEKSYPEMDKLLKLCQIFNCTLDDLVQGDLTPNEPTQLPKCETSHPTRRRVRLRQHHAALRWKISLGVALIIFGNALSLPFFNATDPAINPLFTLPENIATTLGMLFLFLGVIAGLALIIPAGLAHAHFVREHPYIEDFYTKEDKSRARSSFSIQLVGGIACIFAGVCSVILFGEGSENIFGVSIVLSLIALGVCFIIHGGMTLGRTDAAQYNQKASESLEKSEITASPTIPEEDKPELVRALEKTDKRIGAICGTIMIIATIIALLMLFGSLASGAPSNYRSGMIAFFWLPWPIGGLLCGVVALLIKGFSKE